MTSLGIADTSLLVAYLNPRDRHHAWAVRQFERFPSFVTCEPVLAEAAHLVGGPGPVVGLLVSGALRVGYTLAGDERAVAALVSAYADVPMDLADACLVRMAEQTARCEVVTADGDFLCTVGTGTRASRSLTPMHERRRARRPTTRRWPRSTGAWGRG